MLYAARTVCARAPRSRRAACLGLGAAALSWATGCEGPFSALDPAGKDAEQIATLFYVMVAGGGLIWLAVMGLAIYALARPSATRDRKKIRMLVVGGGVAFPTVVLTALLTHGLSLMPELLDPGPMDGLKIRVIGEQWWWRVQYEVPGGAPFELANELRLPVGRRTPIGLEATEIIHAFWVPALAGKIDMIPGRKNRLALEPTRTGVFGGACAEYCGLSHAKMLFEVVVLEPDEFDAWVEAQRAPAARPQAGSPAANGELLFQALGCGACHTVRGTEATGTIGPDLTHVASRRRIGANLLDADRAGLRRWLTDLKQLKPGVHMPSFDMLPERELAAITAYLEGLR